MSSDIRLGIIGAGANTMAKHIPLLQAIDEIDSALTITFFDWAGYWSSGWGYSVIS